MSANRLRTPMVGVRRARRWAVPFLLVLAVVIVAALAFNLANLESVGESIPAPAEPRSRDGGEIVPSPLAGAVMWALIGVLVGGSALLLARRRKRARRPAAATSWWNILASVLGVVILLVVLLAFPRVSRAGIDLEANPANTTAGGASVSPWPIGAGLPIELFLVLSIFASLLWIVYRFRRSPRSVPSPTERPLEIGDARLAASAVVQETIRDLEIGEDVRDVILACFQRFCRLLGDRGIRDQTSLTPRELEGLAVRDLGVSRTWSETLTGLFEEARYSEHALGDAERHRAIESLERIQAALEA